jgi:hypothetical protein
MIIHPGLLCYICKCVWPGSYKISNNTVGIKASAVHLRINKVNVKSTSSIEFLRLFRQHKYFRMSKIFIKRDNGGNTFR